MSSRRPVQIDTAKMVAVWQYTDLLETDTKPDHMGEDAQSEVSSISKLTMSAEKKDDEYSKNRSTVNKYCHY